MANKEKYTFRLTELEKLKREARRKGKPFNRYIDDLIQTHPDRKLWGIKRIGGVAICD